MEANNNKMKKRKTKSNSKRKEKEDSSSNSSKNKKAEISFVLERSNGSIFGDYPSSGGSIGMMGGGY